MVDLHAVGRVNICCFDAKGGGARDGRGRAPGRNLVRLYRLCHAAIALERTGEKMTDYWLVGFLGFCTGLLIGWITYDRPRRRVHRRAHHTARPNPQRETKPVSQDAELSELRKVAGLQ